MTLTLKYFIHQVFILCLWEVIFVFFAIFGLGKVLWFCLTKVSGKNKVTQTYIGFVKICKLVPKVVKTPKWQDIQETKNPKKLQNILELKKIQFQVCKGILVLFKDCFVKPLIVLIAPLLNCIIFCMYVNCVLTEHLAECKRPKSFSKCKVVKIENTKSSPSSFFGFTFLYLPNVYIYEPNEFIHVRVVKQTLQIQIHNSEVD